MTDLLSVPEGMVLRFISDATVILDRRSGTLQARRGETRLAWRDLAPAARTLVAALRDGLDNESLGRWQRATPEACLLSQLLSAGIVQLVTAPPRKGRDAATLAYLAAYTSEPETALRVAQAATVAVIGLGGLGCEVIRHLAALGVRRLVCVDHDRVEASNLNRQFCYSPADLGRPKIDVIIEYLERHAPEVRVAGRQRFVTSEADLADVLPTTDRNCDLVVCCADQPIGRVELACLGAARASHAAFAFVAMHIGRGYWGLIVSDGAMRGAEDFFNSACELDACADVGTVQGAASWENSLLAAHLCDAIVRRLTNLPSRGFLNRMNSVEFSGPNSRVVVDFRRDLSAGARA